MAPARSASEPSRIEDCIQWTLSRIHGQVYRPGMRVPSVRALAKLRDVSPFTAVEAYERLVAEGYLEARRGSGFYVRPRAGAAAAPARAPATIDFSWLLHHMLQGAEAYGPGVGVLPASWLDGARLGAALRALGREAPARWLRPGEGHGFEGCRRMRLPNSAHEARPWVIGEIAPDFRLLDVWALPVQGPGAQPKPPAMVGRGWPGR